MVLCDRFESTVDDFNRSECRKRQSNSYIAIRWNSSQVIIDLSRSNAFLIKLVSFHFLFLRFLLREFGSTNERNEQSILTEIDFF